MYAVLVTLYLLLVAVIILLWIKWMLAKDELDLARCINKDLKEELRELRKKPDVIYECDREACAICKNTECFYTFDVEHAVNFHKVTGPLNAYAENCRHLTIPDVTLFNDIQEV